MLLQKYGRKGHIFELGGVPSGHDQSSACRVGFDLVDDPCQLIDTSSCVICVSVFIGCVPESPLEAVDRSEVACFSVYSYTLEIFFGAIACPYVDLFLLKLVSIC